MVVAFSDASLSLDQILSFQDSALVFMDFMKNENSEGKTIYFQKFSVKSNFKFPDILNSRTL